MKDNRSGLNEFFTSEYRRMAGYVRKLIDDSAERESEDIVQDVITGIFEKADITRPIENITAYAYRSLRNRVIDIIRGRREQLSLDAEDPATGISLLDLLEDARLDIDSEMLFSEFRSALFDSIDRLPDEQRAVIIMTEFEGQSFREISQKTGVPAGTLLSRKSRALEKIRAELNRFYFLLEG